MRDLKLSGKQQWPEWWTQEFGLTSAEARVVEALLKGLTVSAISCERGVSINTVRSQIRSIFHKTQVNRQADLIRLLLRN